MSNHAPGPWRRLRTDLGHEFNQAGMLIDADGAYICRLFHPESPISGTTSLAPPVDQAEGNADLIAAAPELLEACKMALVEISTLQNALCISQSGVDSLVQDVISKAEGEKP